MTNEKKEKKQESTSQANIAGSIHKRLNDLFAVSYTHLTLPTSR